MEGRGTVELTRVEPFSLGRIGGALYAALGLLGLLLFVPFAMIGMLGGDMIGSGELIGGWAGLMIVMVLMPVLYGIIGFVGGLLVGVIYNWLAGFVGGLRITLR